MTSSDPSATPQQQTEDFHRGLRQTDRCLMRNRTGARPNRYVPQFCRLEEAPFISMMNSECRRMVAALRESLTFSAPVDGSSRANIKQIALVSERWPLTYAPGSRSVLSASPLCPALATGAAFSKVQMPTDPSEYPAETVTHSVASAELRQFQCEDLQNLPI
jgi:hypothetical protein